MHHLELHSATLRDAHVVDVVHKIRHAMGSAAAHATCHPCPPGTRDRDHDPATPCEPCGPSTFSALVARTECNGTCAIGSTILSSGATSNAACSECTAGRYGSTMESAHAICQPCAAGRASTQLGATSSSTCMACASGRYSASGSTSCEPSGCTDQWADNFSPSAIVDEGTCTYTCSTLRNRAGSGAGDPGGCLLHSVELGWQRYTHNGAALTGGSLATVPSGESWVIQGR